MANFKQNLAVGRVGESIISVWLQGRGFAVMPAYEKQEGEFKGPQLFTPEGELVLPDLLALRRGECVWFEAKLKSSFSWHRISQKWVTGIDLRHYGEYQEVARRTGLPVWLLFWHPFSSVRKDDAANGCPEKGPVGLFGNNLTVLVKRESHRHLNHGPSGMVYWADTSLRKLAEVHELRQPNTDTGLSTAAP